MVTGMFSYIWSTGREPEIYPILLPNFQNYMEQLMSDLKKQIVEVLNLKHINPTDIGDEQPLFVDGLGLDSIDALELIVLLQRQYNIKLTDPQQGPKIFKSVKTMAEFITTQKNNN
jgi:acyl carrier protein